MKVHDESEWQQQLAEFAADEDNPLTVAFRDFLIEWAEEAEALLEGRAVPPIMALRSALRVVEGRREPLTIGLVGMGLVVLNTFWAPIEDADVFFESMTPIEQNLYRDVAMAKMSDLERKANEEVVPDD